LVAVHKHPSGDPTLSAADVALTVEIMATGQLLDIELLDHLIISQGRWLSLKRLGLGFLKAWHGGTAPRMWSAPASASPTPPARDDSTRLPTPIRESSRALDKRPSTRHDDPVVMH
jgi:hypothetical protein